MNQYLHNEPHTTQRLVGAANVDCCLYKI